jgi:hypothetical protein
MSSYIGLAIGVTFLVGSFFWFRVSFKELGNIIAKKEDRKVNIFMVALDEGIFGARLIAPALILFVGICFLLNFLKII